MIIYILFAVKAIYSYDMLFTDFPNDVFDALAFKLLFSREYTNIETRSNSTQIN